MKLVITFENQVLIKKDKVKFLLEWSDIYCVKPLSSEGGALDISSALSSGMASCTGMISGTLLMSRMVVGGIFLNGLTITVDGAGFTAGTTSLPWTQTAEGQTAVGWTATIPPFISLAATSFNQNPHIVYAIIQITFDDVCSLTVICHGKDPASGAWLPLRGAG